jgi:hypothetical protein
MARTELDDAQTNAPSSVYSGLELGLPKSPSAEGVVLHDLTPRR